MNKHIFFQEANEGNQHDWYKKMYNTIHKVSDGGKLHHSFFFFERICERIRNEEAMGMGNGGKWDMNVQMKCAESRLIWLLLTCCKFVLRL